MTVSEAVSSPEVTTVPIAAETENVVEAKQYIMLNGLLYENTGVTNNVPRCGMTDGAFSEAVPENELPRKNGQANFSGSQGWQHGLEPLTVDVRIKEKWYIFAETNIPYERDDSFGLTVSAENITPTGLTLCFSQSGGNGFDGLSADPAYYIQRKTENGWELCKTVTENYGWNAATEVVVLDGETRYDIDWEWLYASLPEGHYRISRVIFPDEKYYDGYTFRAEFNVE